jgi:DNA-binding beta-propeller fold protein YncE
VGDRPLYLKVAEQAVWVPNSGDGTVSRIDTETNRIVGRPLRVGRSADRVAIGFGSVWVTSAADGTLTRINAQG